MRTRVLLNLEGKHRFVGLLSADRIGALFQYAPEFVASFSVIVPATGIGLSLHSWIRERQSS